MPSLGITTAIDYPMTTTSTDVPTVARRPLSLTNPQLFILDTTILVFAWGAAWTLRFDEDIPLELAA